MRVSFWWPYQHWFEDGPTFDGFIRFWIAEPILGHYSVLLLCSRLMLTVVSSSFLSRSSAKPCQNAGNLSQLQPNLMYTNIIGIVYRSYYPCIIGHTTLQQCWLDVDTTSYMAHDVAATLNQRHWRWFLVATTSCVRWDIVHMWRWPQTQNRALGWTMYMDDGWNTQKTRGVEPMLGWCWPIVYDAGPTSNQHCKTGLTSHARWVGSKTELLFHGRTSRVTDKSETRSQQIHRIIGFYIIK